MAAKESDPGARRQHARSNKRRAPKGNGPGHNKPPGEDSKTASRAPGGKQRSKSQADPGDEGDKPQLASFDILSECILHKDAAFFLRVPTEYRGFEFALLALAIPREIDPIAAAANPIQGVMPL